MKSHSYLALIPDPPVLAGLRAPPAVYHMDGATVLLLFSPDHCISLMKGRNRPFAEIGYIRETNQLNLKNYS